MVSPDLTAPRVSTTVRDGASRRRTVAGAACPDSVYGEPDDYAAHRDRDDGDAGPWSGPPGTARCPTAGVDPVLELAWWDRLVEVEHVAGVVGGLDVPEPMVVLAVIRLFPVRQFRVREVGVYAARSELVRE